MKKYKIYIVIFFTFVVCFGLYHSKIFISSDTTTTLPMSVDFLKGNILLKGWILGSNNFLFTEIMIYAIGLAMQFSYSTLLAWIPGIVWAILIVGTLVFLQNDDYVKKSGKGIQYLLIAAVVSVLGVVPYSVSYTLLNANSHNNLYAFLICYLLLILKFINGNKRALIAATAIALMMSISEGVTSMVLIAPIGCFSILFFLKTKSMTYIKIIASLGASYFFGKAIIKVIELMDGLHTRGFPVSLVSLSDVPIRAKAWLEEAVKLLGVERFLSPAANLLEQINRCILIIIIVWFFISLLYYTINIFKTTHVECILYFICIINIVACILTNVTIFHRYIVPGWFFGISLSMLLFVKLIDRLRRQPVKKCFSMIGMTACFLVIFCRWSLIRQLNDLGENQRAVVEQIENKSYGEGYGSFWCASQVSFYSDYTIPIYPIIVNDSNHLYAYSELVNREWYEERNKHFVIMHENEDQFINKQLLLQILGEPDDSFTSGVYEVYFWKEDISQYIDKSPISQ